MSHDPKDIAQQAKEYINSYGDGAEEAAMNTMFRYMSEEDVNKAAVMLAVIQEIKEMSGVSASVN